MGYLDSSLFSLNLFSTKEKQVHEADAGEASGTLLASVAELSYKTSKPASHV